MKSQVQYSKTQLSLFLIHLACQFQKSFTAKAIQAFMLGNLSQQTKHSKQLAAK